MGSLLMVRPRVLGSLELNTDHKPRTVPIDLEETMQATDEYSIELPDGYVVDELPEPVKLDVGFAAYQSTVEVKGNALHYTRTYTVRQCYASGRSVCGPCKSSLARLRDRRRKPRYPQEALIRSPSISSLQHSISTKGNESISFRSQSKEREREPIYSAYYCQLPTSSFSW